MQKQTGEMERERIACAKQMIDLVTEKREWDVEFGIVGRKGECDGTRRYLYDGGILINEEPIIPADEAVPERGAVNEKRCDREDRRNQESLFERSLGHVRTLVRSGTSG